MGCPRSSHRKSTADDTYNNNGTAKARRYDPDESTMKPVATLARMPIAMLCAGRAQRRGSRLHARAQRRGSRLHARAQGRGSRLHARAKGRGERVKAPCPSKRERVKAPCAGARER
eukprot:365856-Chlamydomonas_euryale.AAC.24